MSVLRTRWAAIGAVVAVTLGAGGIGLVSAIEPSGAAAFVPMTPCRIADTRPASQVGPKAFPVGPNARYTVSAHGTNGDCTIPTGATALSMNVTAVNATADTFLTFWGPGDRPTAANLNPRAGGPPTPNAVASPLTDEGKFNVYNKAGNVDVVIDIVGYHASPAITGADVVDGSLTLSDLGGGEQTRTTGSDILVPAGECRSAGGGNSGEAQIGKLVLFTIADADGNAVIPNGATAVPSVVIGTSQGGAIIQFLVCNGRTSNFTIPAGSVITARLVAP